VACGINKYELRDLFELTEDQLYFLKSLVLVGAIGFIAYS